MRLKKLTVLSILFVVPLLFVTIANAQHFEWEITDGNMSIILQGAELDGESLVGGDEVGLFNANGRCCGGGEPLPDNFPRQVGMAAFAVERGDDNGFEADEVILFRFWDAEAEEEWDDVRVDEINAGEGDDDGNIRYVNNGFFAITLIGNRAEPAPELEIDADIIENGHDFGALRINQEDEWVLPIGNSGGEDLIISDITIEADHFSVDFEEEMNISPGESADITVTFAPTDEGEFSGTLVITWNDPEEGDPIEIEVMGVAEAATPPSIVVNREQLNFGDVVVDENRSSAFSISNEGDETLTISGVTVEGETFSTDFEGEVDIAFGESIDVVVTFAPSAEEVFSSDVIITSNDPDNEEVTVHVVGRGVGENAPPEIGVEEGDEEFFFGYVITGEMRTWRLVILNNGVGDLNVTNMEIDNELFTTDFDNDFRLRGGDRWFTDVTFAPDEDGLYEAVLTITSDDPNNDGILEIPLGGEAGEDRGTHFQWARTENNASILVVEATLDGEALVEGDEIGLFTPSGLLAGGGVVQEDGQTGLAAFGDDPGTDITDGFVEGEEFAFLVWDANADVEAWGVAEFLQELDVYEINGFMRANLVAETGDPAGQLNLSRNNYFFGEVEIEDDSREWTFTIENIGIGDLTIESIESDMNEYSTDFGDEAVVLNPEDGSIEITVVFEPIEERDYNGRLTIISDDPRNEEVYVDLVGIGVIEARNPDIGLSQPNWFFGVTPVDVERTFTLVITSEGGAALELRGVSLEGDEVFSDNFPDQNPVLEPDETFEIEITFSPDDEREFSGVFTIETNRINDEEDPVTFAVSGFGRVSDDHFMHFDTGVAHLFEVSSAVIVTAQENEVPLYPGDEIAVLTPIGLIAGHVVIDEDNQFSIGLAAYADDPDNEVLVGFEDGDEFSFMFWDISTENEIECEVEFTDGPEAFEANGMSEIILTAVAAEEEPLIMVEPILLQFSPTFVDDISEDIITISNIGGVNLTIDGFESEIDEFTLDLQNEIVLEPGESVEITASFTPSAPSGFEGVITILSNDPHVMEYEVILVGMGSEHLGNFLFGNTDVNQSVIIRPTIGGVTPSWGDEVGVFTPAGLCAGSIIYEPGEDFGLAAWGDEANNNLIEGFVDRDEMSFKFYDESQDRVYEGDEVVINLLNGDLEWAANALTVIELIVGEERGDDPISIVQVGHFELDEGGEVTFDMEMSTDDGDWEFSWTNDDEYENVDANFQSEDNVGTFTWRTDNLDAGVYIFEFESTDGDYTDNTRVQVTVVDINFAPVADREYLTEQLGAENRIEYNEDEIIDWTTVLVFETLFSDPDDDNMIFNRAPGNQGGFSHQIFEDENGFHLYQVRAVEDWSGEVEVTLSADDQRDDRDDVGSRQIRRTDGRGPQRDDRTDVTFTVAVLNINDAPMFTAPEDLLDADGNEVDGGDGVADEEYNIDEGQDLVIQFTATDEEDDQIGDRNLSFEMTDAGGLPDEGPEFVDAGDGTATFTWTPSNVDGREEPYTPTFRVTDNGDNDNEDIAFDEITVTINVRDINELPEIANPIGDLAGDNALLEDENAERFVIVDLDDVFNDDDVDDVLEFTIRENPDSLRVEIDDENVLSIFPMEHYHTLFEEDGMLLISVSATDGDAEVTDEFLVEITPVNDAPADFNMLSPEDNPDDLDDMAVLEFSWETALQVQLELDTVRYTVEFWAEGIDDTLVSPELADTSYPDIAIDAIAEFIFGGPGRREVDLVVFWRVLAHDSTDVPLMAANAPYSFTIPMLSVPEDQAGIPGEFFMAAAYPNPFNMETTVKFGIPQPGFVSISVWDMHGRKVADIMNSQLSAGKYTAVWNANGLTSGIYMIRMHSGNFNKLQKSVLVR